MTTQSNMTRVQILLPADQDRRLEEIAAARRQSKASVVRQALDLLFRTEPAAGEPLLDLIGQAGVAGRGDISHDHDRTLSAAELRRKHGK